MKDSAWTLLLFVLGAACSASTVGTGGFIAAGSTNEYSNGYSSLWVVKTDSNGSISGCSDVTSVSSTEGIKHDHS